MTHVFEFLDRMARRCRSRRARESALEQSAAGKQSATGIFVKAAHILKRRLAGIWRHSAFPRRTATPFQAAARLVWMQARVRLKVPHYAGWKTARFRFPFTHPMG